MRPKLAGAMASPWGARRSCAAVAVPTRPSGRASTATAASPKQTQLSLAPFRITGQPRCDDRLSSGHHRRVIRRTTPPVLAIAGVEGREVDVLDRVDHEPRQMVLRQPLAQRRGHQQQLLTITLDEVLWHPRSVLTAADGPGVCETASVQSSTDVVG